MTSNTCPHHNATCRAGSPCTPCSGTGRMLGDGERMRVSMTLMDSVQLIMSAQQPVPMTDAEIRAQALADHQAWLRAGSPKKYLDPVAQAMADGVVPSSMQVNDNGYSAAVAGLDYRTRQIGTSTETPDAAYQASVKAIDCHARHR